jgi:TonB family protein
VVLDICIDRSGHITKKFIVSSSGDVDFERAVITTIANWRYIPYGAGEPVCGRRLFKSGEPAPTVQPAA